MKKMAYVCVLAVVLTGCSVQEQSDQNAEEPAQPVTAADTIIQDTETEQPDAAATRTIGYSVTNNNTMILYMNGEEIQELPIEEGFAANHACIHDYDFDGYEDLYIPIEYSAMFGPGTYYHFNPETNQFETWDELNSIGREMLAESETQTLKLRYNGSDYWLEYFIYQWDDDTLSLIRHETSETGREFRIYSVDAQGNETLTEIINREDENNWRSVYLDVLHEYKQLGVYSSSSAFSLYDINGDSIPELMISDHNYHNAFCRLYTYDDKLIESGDLGSDGVIRYCLDTNTIISFYAGMGAVQDNCYKLENGELIESIQLAKLTRESDGEIITIYNIDSAEVSEAEYQDAYSNMITENCKTLGRDFVFNDAVIEAALTESKDWQQTYRDVLYGYMETEDICNGAGFSLFDVTGDGIPELFLGEDMSHAASCHIFGFQNGLVGYGAHGAYGGISYHPDEGGYNMNMIEVEHVTKKFGEITVLDDITVSFASGQIHGLIGRNGSGKTMLMRCICGFVPVSSESIKVRGQMMKGFGNIPENIGMILETPGFLSGYSAFKNLQFLANIHGKVKKVDVENAIRQVGLDPNSKKHVGKYSLGMHQRLGLAQAIMENPDLLILDEPMNGLDKKGVEDMRNYLLELKRLGKTILLASHSAEDIAVLCDTVWEMDKGRLTKMKINT